MNAIIDLKPQGEATPIPKVPVEPRKICGDCRHSHRTSPDLRVPLQCRYHPPCIGPVFTPQGLVYVTNFPQVTRDHEACFVGYSLKPALQQ